MEFMELLHNDNVPLANEIAQVIANKAGCQGQGRSSSAQQSKTRMLRECEYLMLKKLGTDPVHQMLLVSVAIPT